MTTKELIAALIEADPEGNTDVCVGNETVWFVYPQEAYYDGCLQRIFWDDGVEVGAEYTSEGSKVKIITRSIHDAIFENPYLPIKYVGIGDKYKDGDDRWRQKSIDIHHESERKHFMEYIAKKYGEDMKGKAFNFYNNNMSYNEPLPEDLQKSNDSYYNRREIQWDRQIEVEDDTIYRKVPN